MFISHEVPFEFLEVSRKYNDYDYALVHLFENPDYKEFFEKSLRLGRVVYLDNSVFELGEAFEMESFIKECVNLYKINQNNFYAIIPDVLDDTKATIQNVKKFKSLQPNIKTMAVLQGDSVVGLFDCYREIKDYVNIIGVNHISKAFKGSTDIEKSGNRLEFCKVLNDLAVEDNKKLHSLGVILPLEACVLGSLESFVSIDTSNPVIHGYQQLSYECVESKPSLKLNDIFYEPLNLKQKHHIIQNIQTFRFMAKGIWR